MSPLLIINPSTQGLQSLFGTHPSTKEQIRRLMEIANRFKQAAPAIAGRQTSSVLM